MKFKKTALHWNRKSIADSRCIDVCVTPDLINDL